MLRPPENSGERFVERIIGVLSVIREFSEIGTSLVVSIFFFFYYIVLVFLESLFKFYVILFDWISG